MFSRTLSAPKGCTIWKVRTRPSRQMRCGAMPVISRPSKRTLPASGGRKPATMAKSVVLPAPFGPISAVMRPACASSDASETATRPPKRLTMPRASRTAT